MPIDCSGSSDPDGDSITCCWDLDATTDANGDGDPANDCDEQACSVSVLFPVGQSEIAINCDDGKGGTCSDTTTVTVSEIRVPVDVKPGSYPNSINMGSHGVVPVAFLTTAEFDAGQIDPATVTLRGEDFSGFFRLKGKKQTPQAAMEDVDGDLDLVVHIETERLSECEVETILDLGALTYDGYVVSGSDSVRIVPEQ